MNLLLSQKNALFDLISENGFSNSQFTLLDESADNLSTISYNNSIFYFSIADANTGKSIIEFSPAYDQIIKDYEDVSWNSVVDSFKYWLKYLKREVTAEDKWARLDQEIKSANISFESETDKFSFAEYQEVKVKVEVLKDQIKAIPLELAQAEAINNKLDHLIVLAETSSKFDWKAQFVGTIIAIIIQLSVSPANAKALWDLIKHVFSGYFLN